MDHDSERESFERDRSDNSVGGDAIEHLRARALAAGRAGGLAAVGVTSAAVLEPARSVLHRRKAAGLADSMQFTYRNPDRSTDPHRSLPSAQAIVAGAYAYRRSVPDRPDRLSGRVARYAWRDFYGALEAGLGAVAEVLNEAGYRAQVHADSNNLVDRNVAHDAGLGWYGKNANLLLGDQGSWFVLGGVITDAPLRPASQPQPDGCGACRRCQDGCPTQAIVAPGVIDARRCLAWLVQGPGPIPEEFRLAVGDRLYGCDDCQDVCPPNRLLDTHDEGPELEGEADPWIELDFVLTASDETLLDRVGRWYIADRDPDVVRRTALVVLGNIGSGNDARTRRLLTPYLRHDRTLLREHAQWAARQLGLAD